jgi:hypothetical protein
MLFAWRAVSVEKPARLDLGGGAPVSPPGQRGADLEEGIVQQRDTPVGG